MAYVRQSQLRQRPRLFAKAESWRVLQEAQKSASGRTVFLSHSHLDKESLASIIDILAEHGASAYVDADDEDLPKTPSSKTATVLRGRIRECPRFILVASGNLRRSRWTPWELGFADGAKGLHHAALFPIVLDQTGASTVSVEQEYIDAYPVVEEVTLAGGTGRAEYAVRNPLDGKYWRLRTWLHDSIQ